MGSRATSATHRWCRSPRCRATSTPSTANPTYIVCRSGAAIGPGVRVPRRARAAHVVNVAGGMIAWAAAGFDVATGAGSGARRCLTRRSPIAGSIDRTTSTTSSTPCSASRGTRSTPSSTASAPTTRSSRWCRSPGAPTTARSWRSSTRSPSTSRRSRKLFSSDALCVIHAAQQDLDVLTHAVGSVPARMFDTQLAAGFVGYGTPSLVSLLQGEIGVSPPKGDRLTDWLRRPLTRQPVPVRRRRRRVPARGPRASGRAARRGGTPGVGRGRLRGTADASDQRIGARRRLAATEGCSVVAAERPGGRPERGGVARATGDAHRRAGASGAARSRHSRDLAAGAVVDRRSCRRPAASTIGTLVAASPRRSSKRCARPRGRRRRRRRRRPTISTATCARRSRWCRPGWASSPATSGSIRRCWPRGPTSWRSCAATTTPGWASGWRNELVGDGIRRLVGGEAGLTFDPRGPPAPARRVRLTSLVRPVPSAAAGQFGVIPRNPWSRRYPVPECQLSRVWEPCREEGSSSPVRRGEKTEAVRSGSL